MARFKNNLLDLDINQLFQNYKVEEIVETVKLLDNEIEKKRAELRSMVGDRYKDILTASDSIKNMESISANIVRNIQNISNACEILVSRKKALETSIPTHDINKEKLEEYTIAIQIRLTLFIIEHIWISLDQHNNLEAAQFYLLAKNIETGLNLTNSILLQRIPLIKQIKTKCSILQDIILNKVKMELESIELTPDNTCSNLNSLMLLQNQSTQELLSIYVAHRKIALKSVIQSSYSSVRVQVTAMVRCLLTTIHLLFDCFISLKSDSNGLIWKQLENIINNTSLPTLSKLQLSESPLNLYIPEIVKEFRPNCKFILDNVNENLESIIEEWLSDTKDTIKLGLQHSLELVTTVKGLFILREEALKVEVPPHWEEICLAIKLPKNFNIWFYFFQNLITDRVQTLISKNVKSNLETLYKEISNCDLSNVNTEEVDLRSYIWSEDVDDMNSLKDKNFSGLSMKTRGYSKRIVQLCKVFDDNYLNILCDVCQYFYGVEFDEKNFSIPLVIKDYKFKKKFVDVEYLENHLVKDCTTKNLEIINYLESILKHGENDLKNVRSLIFIRFLQAITNLCRCFKKCCTLNGTISNWQSLCDKFDKTCIQFWQNWLDESALRTEKEVDKHLNDLHLEHMMTCLIRWDVIEIQEQTEDKVFKSQIKVPLKSSLALEHILTNVNDTLCRVLPHTMPKVIHVQFIEAIVEIILNRYKKLSEMEINQNQALQFLFDVRFLTTFSVLRENSKLVGLSQEICDKFRSKVDPFDLDVFYSYLQVNVKRAVVRSQVILGCLLPSSIQTANLGISEKSKEQEREPSILAVSTPSTNSWFQLLPVTVPLQKNVSETPKNYPKIIDSKSPKTSRSQTQETGTSKTSASSIFGGLTTEWFS